ncbi:AzlC family ABC transporter permease [Marinospirillum sp.]|uniref:AzlC family ABC transporter permease n=1 Tax=Marinospirillum sp. TaxID=2183934 RepID=UPI003A8370E3
MSASAYTTAFKTSLPVLFGYLPLGAAFGVVFATSLDFAWWIAPLMGLVIYAGAGQLLAVSLLMTQTGLLEVFLAMFLLNIRHLFYGLSLLQAFEGAGWRKAYLIFGLTDETYSLLTARPRSKDRAAEQQQDFLITLYNQLYWIAGCALGAWLGHTLTFDASGIEFALVALFIILCIEQYLSLQTRFPIWVGLAAGISVTLLIPSSQQLVVALGLTLVALLWQYPSRRHLYTPQVNVSQVDTAQVDTVTASDRHTQGGQHEP